VGNAQVVVGPTQGPGGNFYEIVFLPSSADAVKWTKADALAEVRTSVVGAASVHLATITTPEEDVFIEKLRQQVWILMPAMLLRFGWAAFNQTDRPLLPPIGSGWMEMG
jgi:hypothetical protein